MGENMKKYLLGIFFCVLMLFSLSATIPSQQLNDPDASWNMSGIYADLEARGEPEDTVAMVWIPLSDGDYFIMQMKTRCQDACPHHQSPLASLVIDWWHALAGTLDVVYFHCVLELLGCKIFKV